MPYVPYKYMTRGQKARAGGRRSSYRGRRTYGRRSYSWVRRSR